MSNTHVFTSVGCFRPKFQIVGCKKSFSCWNRQIVYKIPLCVMYFNMYYLSFCRMQTYSCMKWTAHSSQWLLWLVVPERSRWDSNHCTNINNESVYLPPSCPSRCCRADYVPDICAYGSMYSAFNSFDLHSSWMSIMMPSGGTQHKAH